MKLYLGTDHAGFELKEKIKTFLLEKNYNVEDCGAFEFNKIDDYPDFISKTAIKTTQNPNSFGIIFGKSGAGECMVANKIKGVRAFLAINEENVKLAREDNDANIISFGSRITNLDEIKKLVIIFLETKFTNEERHLRRINKIKTLEKNLYHINDKLLNF